MDYRKGSRPDQIFLKKGSQKGQLLRAVNYRSRKRIAWKRKGERGQKEIIVTIRKDRSEMERH